MDKDERDTLDTDQDAGEMQAKTSSSSVTTTDGPDSDVDSVEDLPTEEDNGITNTVTEDLSHKVSASANYLGSFFTSAWSKTTKTANDVTTNSSSFISSAFNKVSGGHNTKEAETDPEAESKEEAAAGADDDPNETDEAEAEAHPSIASSFIPASATNLLSSAFNTFGFKKGHAESSHEVEAETEGDKAALESDTDGATKNNSRGFTGLSSAFSAIGTMAADATHSIKEKVGTRNLLSKDFHKDKDNVPLDEPVLPWEDHHREDELKAKILSLSQEKRHFTRAPPEDATFDFDYEEMLETAKLLLKEDPNLEKMRYKVVPKKVSEEEFWRNYFYRVSLAKQQFDLEDMQEDVEGDGRENQEEDNKECSYLNNEESNEFE